MNRRFRTRKPALLQNILAGYGSPILVNWNHRFGPGTSGSRPSGNNKEDLWTFVKTTILVEDESGEQVKKTSHGPNWLLGRSGKCKKIMKDQQPKLFTSGTAATDIDDLKKIIREKIMTEMQEIVDRKVSEKMSKVIAKLGEINPDFKHLDVAELCAGGDESEDSDEDHDHREDDNDHQDDECDD